MILTSINDDIRETPALPERASATWFQRTCGPAVLCSNQTRQKTQNLIFLEVTKRLPVGVES